MFFNKNKNYGIRQDVNGLYHIYEGKCGDKDLLNNICNTLNADKECFYYIVEYKYNNRIEIITDALTRKHFRDGEYNHKEVSIISGYKYLSDAITAYYEIMQEKSKGHTYIILSEYPNMFIDRKEIASEDQYNYCLKDFKTKNLMIVEKQNCFKDYEDAVNALAKKIQSEKSNIEQGLVFDKNTGKIS